MRPKAFIAISNAEAMLQVGNVYNFQVKLAHNNNKSGAPKN